MTFSGVLGVLGIVFALIAAVVVVLGFVQGHQPGVVELSAVAIALLISSNAPVR